MSEMIFAPSELEAIRKFFVWVDDGNWLDNDEGIVGVDERGINIVEFSAVSDYDSYTLEREATFIPWIALTDPAEFDRQQAAERAEDDARRAAQQRQHAAEAIARERQVYEILKAKYGS